MLDRAGNFDRRCSGPSTYQPLAWIGSLKTAAVRSLFLVVLVCVAGVSGAAQEYPIDEATHTGIIATLKQKISEEYVFPDKVKRIVERIGEKERRGAYFSIHSMMII